MKTVTFFLVCMAWIKRTISPPTGAALTLPEVINTFYMVTNLARKTHEFEASARNGAPPVINNSDGIMLYKVIDGQFKHGDVAGGFFGDPVRREELPPVGAVPVDHIRQRGEIEVTLGNPDILYRANLFATEDNVNHGYEGRVKYFCTIETNRLIHLVGILRPKGQYPIRRGVPKVKYANERHQIAGDDYHFVGELHAATRENVRLLLRML